MVKKNHIKYLILGNGYIGNRLKGYLSNSHVSKKRILKSEDIEKEISKYDPKFVINCIGITGTPNVDWCENNKQETMFGNVTVPLLILSACQKFNKKMVHIGTGCIYEGDNNGSGFTEADEPNFFGSFYSRTKLISENALKEFDVLQFRIRMLVDSIHGSKNLITKLLTYNNIINIPNSVTVIDDFLLAAKKLMEMNETGIFNIVNPGLEFHKDVIDIYNKYSREKKKYKIISINKLHKATLARRSSCVLLSQKLIDRGIIMRDAKIAIEDCIRKISQT